MDYNHFMTQTKQTIQDILPLFGIDPGEPVRQIYKSAWDVGGRYILKKSTDHVALEKSVRLSGLLAARGVPVPEYTAKSVEADGTRYALMKIMRGSHIDPYKGDPYGNGVLMGRLVAGLHAALREIPDTFGCPDADYMLQLDEYIVPEIYVPKHVLEYARAFEPLCKTLPRQLIHRDVHTGNMLFQDGAFTGWLDFDNAERNARMHDLCYLGATMLAGNYRERRRLQTWRIIFRSVLRGYNKISPLTEEERQAVPYMFVHIELLFAAFFSRNGQGKTSKKCLNMAKWLYRHRGILVP